MKIVHISIHIHKNKLSITIYKVLFQTEIYTLKLFYIALLLWLIRKTTILNTGYTPGKFTKFESIEENIQ